MAKKKNIDSDARMLAESVGWDSTQAAFITKDELKNKIRSRYRRKDGAYVCCVSVHKGGAGKTSLAVNMCYALSHEYGFRVLLIDADSQMDATHAVIGGADTRHRNLYRALALDEPFDDYVFHTNYTGFDMIAADTKLSAVESILISQQNTGTDSVYTVKKNLENLSSGGAYDFIIIDTDKNIGLFSRALLTASTHALMVSECSMFHISGVVVEESQVRDVRRSSNPGLRSAGVVLNKVSERKSIVAEARAALDSALPGERYANEIHQDAAFEKSQWNGVPIGVYEPSGRGYGDIKKVAGEFLTRLRAEDGEK